MTSGLSARMVIAADSVFFIPMRLSAWTTWRWRFDRSTTSKSTIPRVPTPAAPSTAAPVIKPASTDEQHLRLREPGLTFGPDFRHHEVSGVARVSGDRRGVVGKLPRPTFSLPQADPTSHGGDVLVAHRGHLHRGAHGSDSTGAVHDNLLVEIWSDLADLGEHLDGRNQRGAGQVACLPLVLLARVDQDRALCDQLLRLGWHYLAGPRSQGLPSGLICGALPGNAIARRPTQAFRARASRTSCVPG